MKRNREVVANTLINTRFFNTDTPVVITFSPAGAVLTEKDVESGINAWGYDHFEKQKVNIIAFSAITTKHWFVEDALFDYIQTLSTELLQFPERLGYGASMGAYALSIYFQQLHIDRLLLITPIPSFPEFNERSGFNYSQEYQGKLFIIFDPLCPADKKSALRYPSQAKYLKFPAVGHQVIESLSHLKLLSPLLTKFINNNIDKQMFAVDARKRRTLSRYYSYMAKNPTKKGSRKRKMIFKLAHLNYLFMHPQASLLKMMEKWKKSINKRLN